MMQVAQVLSHYGLNEKEILIIPIKEGLINSTWKICAPNDKFILQKINTAVFKKPEDIDNNIRLIAAHLQKQLPGYLFTNTVTALDGSTLIWHLQEAYRMFSFIENSHTISSVSTPEQAYEAASQFAKFTAILHALDINSLKITLPNFHNLSLRYSQFETACNKGNSHRIAEAKELINALKSRKDIVKKYKAIVKDPEFRIRVTHHDTKISNVLFDENNKGLCVIDLDTVMPGYFISDVGDMMRTYLCAANEDEKDFSKIVDRKEVFKAIVEGYSSQMHNELTAKEKAHFLYAGLFMTYMQAIRFLTDYILDDVYYGSAYPGHNLIRASNQWVLLENMEKELL